MPKPALASRAANPNTSKALPKPASAAPSATSPEPSAAATRERVSELRVSGQVMSLDRGLFCLFHHQVTPSDGSGLPGIRVSLPPGDVRSGAVSIATFRKDGWLAAGDDAALVRVAEGTGAILITIYQSPRHGPEQAPRLQVVKLSGDEPPQSTPARAPAATPEMVAHIQRAGDVGGRLGDWLGVRGSQRWIEGFGLAPQENIKPADIEYQAVLGRGWLSPWSEGGKFCGSRGMALPLLGVRFRLRGEAAESFDLTYSATFVDGTAVGPVPAGEACEAESLAALEAFQIILTPKGSAKTQARARPAPVPTTPAPRGSRPATPAPKRSR